MQEKLPPVENPFEVDALTYQLSDQVLNSGRSISTIVFLGLGGGHIANKFVRESQISRLSVRHTAIETNVDPVTGNLLGYEFGQRLHEEDVAGEDVLMLDGVCRGGHKMQIAMNHAESLGARTVSSAVLYYLGPLASRTGLVPDWYVMGPKKFEVQTPNETSSIQELKAYDAKLAAFRASRTVDEQYWADYLVRFHWNAPRPASTIC